MPINPPLFPLTPTFDNSYSTAAKTNKSQYNEGGSVVRGLIGINTLTKTFKFDVATDKISATEDFLTNYLGMPFQMSFDGGTTRQAELWRIAGYQWKYLSPTVRSLSCELEQVRRFRTG